MKISSQINALLEKVLEFQNEIEVFKSQVEVLEQKNEQLSAYLKKDEKSKSTGNLIKLYEQGFHICHESFGQMRDEDCLFCLNIIGRTDGFTND